MNAEITLHDYWRSAAAWRVRIGLHLKGLPFRQVPVHLAKGEQRKDIYLAKNPQGLVPMIETRDVRLTQSLAILEWLDETAPTPPLLPATPEGRARVRAMAQLIACDIHPLNNLRVLKYLTGPLARGEEEKAAWYRHWIGEGLQALEKMAEPGGRFCFGNSPTLADCCLIPQIYNARRFNCDLSAFPTLTAIDAHCATLPAFKAAHAESQPDAEKPA